MRLPPSINPATGGTSAERLDMAFRKVLTVTKESLIREEVIRKGKREKTRMNKKAQ